MTSPHPDYEDLDPWHSEIYVLGHPEWENPDPRFFKCDVLEPRIPEFENQELAS